MSLKAFMALMWVPPRRYSIISSRLSQAVSVNWKPLIFFTSQNRLPGADLAWLKEGMAKNQNRKLAKKFLGLSPVMEICMGQR